MPTGSGKTLLSLRLALEMVKRSGGKLKRIIYVIPYTSIIEQTAKTFSDIIGEYADIVQHHSNFIYDDTNEDDLTAAKLKKACENWDAPIVITTSVQFFESLYHYKSSRLRKLHNISESVIVFDEIHLLPIDQLQPCLKGVGHITKYLDSKALFLSATMPDYKKLFEKYIPECCINELITDKCDFKTFDKCQYINLGEQSAERIAQHASTRRSSLIVVNSRRSAREVYDSLSGNKYHLSTFMTPHDRTNTIDRIRTDLKKGRQVCVVSTSLIEAGVDLDFETVFRQLAGLDSILQAGGRCNREGKLSKGEVYFFSTQVKTSGTKHNAVRLMACAARAIKSGLLLFEKSPAMGIAKIIVSMLMVRRRRAPADNAVLSSILCPFISFCPYKTPPSSSVASPVPPMAASITVMKLLTTPVEEGQMKQLFNISQY